MFSNQPAQISLEKPCRTAASMRPLSAGGEESRFVVGGYSSTKSIDSTAELHILDFFGDTNELVLKETLRLQEDDSSPSPMIRALAVKFTAENENETLFLTAHQGQKDKAYLWKYATDTISADEADASNDSVQVSATLQPAAILQASHNTQICDIQWWSEPQDYFGTDIDDHDPSSYSSSSGGAGNSGNGDILLVDTEARLSQWDLATDGSTVCIRTDESMIKNAKLGKPSSTVQPKAAWDPHGNGHLLAASYGPSVNLIDWRLDTSIPLGTVTSWNISHAPNASCNVTDLDYNPNKPYVVATASRNGGVTFWDTRSVRRPLLAALGGHNHYATNVVYNKSHDQLVLSTGTDGLVNLWRASTISSAPLLTFSDQGSDGDNDSENIGYSNSLRKNESGDAKSTTSDTAAANVRVSTFDHGESVYGACWSQSDPWIYMSVSFDGKVVVHHVPSKEKYKILL